MADTHDITAILPLPGPQRDAERLLLVAIRRMAVGGLNDAHAANHLLGAFGLGFRRPLILLRALLAEMSRASTRSIMLAPCCCPRMTAAESQLLSAVAIATEQPHRAHQLLSLLLGVPNCLGTLSSAQAVGQAFADLGRPLRTSPTPS